MIEKDTRLYPHDVSTELGRALYLIRQIVRDGLNHGYFECTIRCTVENSRKRRLIVTSGKSHQFVILPEELSKADQQ
jgi:hypothetical protein